MFRDVMLNNKVLNIVSLVVAIIEMLIVLLIGLRVFYKSQDEFILNI